MTSNHNLEVCIIGAGIVGASTAYYLTHPSTSTRLPSKLTIIDPNGIAKCASGLSGGFMAKVKYCTNSTYLTLHTSHLSSFLVSLSLIN